MTTPPSTRFSASPFDRDAQHKRKQAAIIDIAARLFNAQGSRATTLMDIANHLKLTKTSLYYYVKTKEELVYLCYLNSLQVLESLIDQAEDKESAPLRVLDKFIDVYFDHWLQMERGDAPATTVLAEISTLSDAHQREIHDGYRRFFNRILRHVENGVARDVINTRNPKALTHAIVSILQWSVTWLPEISLEQVGEVAETLKSILHSGLANWTNTIPKATLALPQDRKNDGFDKAAMRQRKQDAFIKTASALFNEKGYKAVSLDEIAQNLKVTKGAFYYHIKNKDDLIAQCFTRAVSLMNETHALAESYGGDGLTRLFLSAKRLFIIQNSDAGPFIKTTHLIGLPKKLQNDIMDDIKQASINFGSFIREGLHDHSIRRIDAKITQEIVLGTIMGSYDLSMWQDIYDLDAAAHDYLDFIITGIAKK